MRLRVDYAAQRPKNNKIGFVQQQYRNSIGPAALAWLLALGALGGSASSIASPVQFDLSRLQARGLPLALAEYYANGPRFSPGYSRVALYVNGASRGYANAYFDADGELCMTAELLGQAGLVLPGAKVSRTYAPKLPAPGLALKTHTTLAALCYDYRAAFSQTQIKLHPSAARVELIVPPQAVLPPRKTPRQFVSGGGAGMLNYDVRMTQWQFEQWSRANVSARIEAGFNVQDWIVRSRQSWTKTAHRSMLRHDAAYAQRTLHGRGTIMQVGQLHLANAVTGGAALHGVQILPDDALIATEPHAARIEGIASSQARVDVSQAGRQIYTTVVPPGPFSISQFEVPNDTSDLLVTVTENDGTKREFVVPASSLMADSAIGVPGFSVAVGHFSGLSGFYPAVAVTAGQRFGTLMSSGTTILSSSYQAAAAALSIMPRVGPTIAARLHLSRQSAGSALGAHAGIRARGQLGRNVSASVSGSFRTAGFRHSFETRPHRSRCSAMDFSARLDYAMRSYGTIGLGYGQSFQAGTTASRYVTGSISTRIAGILVGFTAQCDSYQSRRSRTSTYLSVSVPFGRIGGHADVSLSDSALRSGVRMHNRIQDHTNYSASIQRDHALRAVSANLDINHHNRFTNMSANMWRSARSSSYSATLSGALAVHGGGLGFSPYRITDTFGIASTSGVPGIKLLTRTGIVETDSRGQAILPSLPAYVTSPVEITTRSLPRNADVDNGYRTVLPARGSVQNVRFNVTTVRRVLLDVTTQDGVPIQRGSPVLDHSGNMVATALDEQKVFVPCAAPDKPLTVRLTDGRRCQLTYTLPDPPDSNRTFERATAHCLPLPDER